MRPRCGAGPPGAGNLLAAVAERYSLFFLGARTLESFRGFGILPAFAGVVVSDRYANYFHRARSTSPGRRASLI